MAKKKLANKSAVDIADELLTIRKTLTDYKKLDKELSGQLMTALKMEGIKQAGQYQISTSSAFKVVDEELAMQFALERGLAKIDTAKVHKVFQLDSNLRFDDPVKYGFEETTQEKLSPMKGTYNDEE